MDQRTTGAVPGSFLSRAASEGAPAVLSTSVRPAGGTLPASAPMKCRGVWSSMAFASSFPSHDDDARRDRQS